MNKQVFQYQFPRGRRRGGGLCVWRGRGRAKEARRRLLAAVLCLFHASLNQRVRGAANLSQIIPVKSEAWLPAAATLGPLWDQSWFARE